jgi:hypothetical protein
MKTQAEPRPVMTPERAYQRGREAARRNQSFNSVKFKDARICAAWEKGFEAEKFGKKEPTCDQGRLPSQLRRYGPMCRASTAASDRRWAPEFPGLALSRQHRAG